jgi:hypothetical protein
MSGKPSSPSELGCTLDVIGVVRSAHTDIASTPVQAALNQREKGIVEIFEPLAEGLGTLRQGKSPRRAKPMLTAGFRWAPETLPMNKMIDMTINPGATTAAVRLIVSGNA